jgi:hypothetical protein
MFTIGHAQDVSFKVAVMGTSAEPSVRLILGCTPELSFPARKTVDGEWLSTVTIPTGISPCECDLRVEAVVNSKVFTPLVKRVELISLDEPEVVPPATLPAPPVEEPVAQLEPAAAVPPVELPVVFRPEGVEPPTTTGVEYKKEAKKPLGLLKSMAEATPAKVHQPVVTPLPKPGSVKAAPIKVSLSDISKLTETVKVTTKPSKQTKVLEIKSDIPTRLIKGPVVYE